MTRAKVAKKVGEIISGALKREHKMKPKMSEPKSFCFW